MRFADEDHGQPSRFDARQTEEGKREEDKGGGADGDK